VRLDGGTISDGKGRTYERCVEAVLGSAETFFTSVFSAQGRRQLSAYKNAEIKTLLADLLGLEEIRQLGAQAAETAKLIRAGLTALRHELGGVKTEESNARAERARLGDVQARMATAQRQRTAAQTALDIEKSRLAQMSAERQVAQQTEERRKQLRYERTALIDDGKRALASLDEQDHRESDRLVQIERRVAKRAESLRASQVILDARRNKLVDTLRHAPRIAHAVRRLPLAEIVTAAREQRLLALRETARFDTSARTRRNSKRGRRHRRKPDKRRYGRRNSPGASPDRQVPCSGTDLRCRQLLGDARKREA
jgi:exonuclease SbcC